MRMKKRKSTRVGMLNRIRSNNDNKFEVPNKQCPDTSKYEYREDPSDITLNVASLTANAFQSLYVFCEIKI